jgi:hypothetical protein
MVLGISDIPVRKILIDKSIHSNIIRHRICMAIAVGIILTSLPLSIFALDDSDTTKVSNTEALEHAGIRSFDCKTIQKAIDALPPIGGMVIIQAGTYNCRAPVVIDRDNVDLRGMGSASVLRLADNTNAPVLLIGNITETPTVLHTNIHVSDIVIDGNRENQNQTFECWGGECGTGGHTYIRNNGITLRHVSDVLIERVTVKKARSGGLVSERNNQRVSVHDFTSFDNHFDGLAAYLTENSIFSDLYLHDNLAAGLSFDIGFNNNILSNVIITRSGTVGVFMRDSRDNLLNGFQIRNSTEHGVFLAQVGSDNTKPASGNTLSAIFVSGSGGAGLRANDPSDVNNLVIGSQFIGNSGGCISEAMPGLVQSTGTICR